jgi:hypothetical protein
LGFCKSGGPAASKAGGRMATKEHKDHKKALRMLEKAEMKTLHF